MTQSDRRFNKQLVDKVLEEVLTPALQPLIRRKMESRYGSSWLQDAPLGLEDYYFDGNDLKWNDPAAVISLLLDQWSTAFFERNKLDKRELSWVHEIRNTRNDVKHNNDVFDYDYSFRALDSMERLLSAAEAKKAAQEVKQLKEQLQKSPPVGVRPEFQALIQEKTEGFVGREFVFKAIQDFLTSQSKGYFIIEADPGVGKSAILAEYVRRTKCVFHFNIRSQAINRAEQFLQGICSQIISRYSLPYPLNLPPDATRDGEFLGKLLEEASAKLKSRDKLVIAVDALDEVDQTDHNSSNILYLPITLPKGVYFVLTQRLITIPLNVNPVPLRFDLMQYQAESLQDIQTYIRSRIQKSPTLRKWINGQGLSIEDFVTQLRNKSENNFMYLRYVLGDIETGKYRNLSIDSLPQGLMAYYEDHWRRMGMLDRPLPMHKVAIVYFLAELREPVSRRSLAELCGEKAVAVQMVLDEWQQFLRETQLESETRYSIYHQSFSDFLYRKDIVQAYGNDFS
jgi:Swt1-like HEPN